MKKALTIFWIGATLIVLSVGLRYVYFSVIQKHNNREVSVEFDNPSVSGIFPHLALFNENHSSEKPGETGIGAVVPWGDKLYAITYSAHKPKGSSDKLYVIDKKGNLETHPLSIGGTPANRMIHKESRQLIIGPYFIKESGEVRVVSIDKMPGRLTATTRHLEDPKNKVYFYTMEEGLYEVDVYSLDVTKLYEDGNMRTPPDVAGPLLPGYHGKGGYVSQDRLVVANNGEYYWQSTNESGSLSEWDGRDWKVIERKQFTEVTGPGGLYGNENDSDPIWSIGWDKKSLILKLREAGEWSTYRLPKASFTYDGQHGWHTEWPRIRDIGQDKWLMTMHGMFWAFPPGFSRDQTSGIYPRSSYLKIIPDFATWEGMLVMGCDDASMFDNSLVGQPQSNFWFIQKDELDSFGPKIAFGGPWIDDKVKAYEASDPFLVSGFDRGMIYTDKSDDTDGMLVIERKNIDSDNWERWKIINLKGKEPQILVLETNDTEWIRFIPELDMDSLTVVMHFSPEVYPERNADIFENLQPRGSADINMGYLRPNGKNGDLQIFTMMKSYADVNASLEFTEGEMDEKLLKIRENLVPKDSPISYDSASVIYTDKTGQRWRLPYGYHGRKDGYHSLKPRLIREVATERSLMNAGGLFYELPRDISGGISKVKPITTHNKMIFDFCSWRGMMAITGSNPRAKANDHFIKQGKEGYGLWLGTIDDLWKFGKPTGKGGPWKDTEVEGGESSDAYLMYGFDKKTLELSHDSDEPVTFEVLCDFVGEGEFRDLGLGTRDLGLGTRDSGNRSLRGVEGAIHVKPGEVKTIEFEDGFSAFWVKVKAGKTCKATATFKFQ